MIWVIPGCNNSVSCFELGEELLAQPQQAWPSTLGLCVPLSLLLYKLLDGNWPANLQDVGPTSYLTCMSADETQEFLHKSQFRGRKKPGLYPQSIINK